MRQKQKKGFTLVEILVAIVVLGILSAVLIPKITTESDRAKEAGIDVDFRGFYLSSKTIFTLSDTSDYDTLNKFEKMFNKNSTAQAQFNNGKGNIKDPWDNNYELHVKKLEDNNTYIVFTSKGVKERDGWIFEPDNLNNRVRWTPKTPICDCHKYFLVLGRTEYGKEIRDIETEIVYQVIHGDGGGGAGDDGGGEDDQWAFLGFEVETDGIKIEHDEEENGDLYYMTYDIGGGAGGYPPSYGGPGGQGGSGGSGGYLPNPVFPDPMDFNRTTGGVLYISDTPLLPAYYLMAWNKTIGGNNGGYQVYTEVPTTFTTTYDGDGYASNINKDTNISEDDNKIEMEVSVGNGNKIVLTYNRADAHPETKMFKVGSSVTMKAVPASPDYIFNYWKVDGVKDETNDIKTITVQADTKFTAVFRMNLDISGGKLYTKSGENFTEYYENNIVGLDEITDTWQVGDNVTATLSESGVLSLTGSGKVTSDPWASKKDSINEINIGNGIDTNGRFSNYTLESLIVQGNNIITASNEFLNLKITNLTIGDGSTLNYMAFYGAKITNLNIAKNVTFINHDESGISAFGNTRAYEAAKIDNLTINSNIPTNGFHNSEIKTLTIGSNVNSIGHSAFKGCQITNSPNLSNVETIGGSAFELALLNADSITIKQGTTIGASAFYGCNINNLILQGENDVNSGAFVELKANSVTIGDGSNLRRGSFNESIITNLNIAKNVILESYESSYSVFGNTRAYEAAKIENLTIDSNIPISGFLNSEIKTLNIGSNATSIGYSAFKGCQITNTPNLSNIESIGNNAFELALLNADSITIKQGVELGSYTFRRCTIKNLTLQGNNTLNNDYQTTFLGLMANNVIIGDGSIIAAGSFSESNIINLTIGKNVNLKTSSNKSAFGSTTNWASTKIKNLTIDSDIPNNGFYNSEIETLNIGSNVRNIGVDAFKGCLIANTPNLNNVVSIGNGAFFSALKDADSITINNGVTIGESSFRDCSIGSLTIDINIPSYSFYDSNIKTLSIGSNVNNINIWAFYGSSVTEALIDNAAGNVNINNQAFPASTVITYLK